MTKNRALTFAIFFSSISGLVAGSNEKDDRPCPTVTTPPDFDLKSFTSKRWHVHQQAPTQYLPIERNYCVYADYRILEQKTFPWRYEVSVYNHAADREGEEYGGPLCAFVEDPKDNAKLKVAPCFLPKFVAGPYWVLAYDEGKGYALVTGGQPNVRSENGLCTTGTGTYDSGIWIFLRSLERDDALIEEARAVASKFELDLSVLNDVDQTNCSRYEDDDAKDEEEEAEAAASVE